MKVHALLLLLAAGAAHGQVGPGTNDAVTTTSTPGPEGKAGEDQPATTDEPDLNDPLADYKAQGNNVTVLQVQGIVTSSTRRRRSVTDGDCSAAGVSEYVALEQTFYTALTGTVYQVEPADILYIEAACTELTVEQVAALGLPAATTAAAWNIEAILGGDSAAAVALALQATPFSATVASTTIVFPKVTSITAAAASLGSDLGGVLPAFRDECAEFRAALSTTTAAQETAMPEGRTLSGSGDAEARDATDSNPTLAAKAGKGKGKGKGTTGNESVKREAKQAKKDKKKRARRAKEAPIKKASDPAKRAAKQAKRAEKNLRDCLREQQRALEKSFDDQVDRNPAVDVTKKGKKNKGADAKHAKLSSYDAMSAYATKRSTSFRTLIAAFSATAMIAVVTYVRKRSKVGGYALVDHDAFHGATVRESATAPTEQTPIFMYEV